jgi:hypothetical protein
MWARTATSCLSSSQSVIVSKFSAHFINAQTDPKLTIFPYVCMYCVQSDELGPLNGLYLYRTTHKNYIYIYIYTYIHILESLWDSSPRFLFSGRPTPRPHSDIYALLQCNTSTIYSIVSCRTDDCRVDLYCWIFVSAGAWSWPLTSI